MLVRVEGVGWFWRVKLAFRLAKSVAEDEVQLSYGGCLFADMLDAAKGSA